jgi:hypothetical protein
VTSTEENQQRKANIIALARSRLENENYDALFSGGCCFHFALQSFRAGIGKIVYSGNGTADGSKTHVFVITPGGQAFDHNGYANLADLMQRFAGWNHIKPTSLSEGELMQAIDALDYPVDLTADILAVADKVIRKKMAP